MSNSLQSHGLQRARPPYQSPTLGVYSNSCPSCRWCHSTISSSVFPFSSCLQSFPASGSFQMSQLFTKEEKWPKYWSFSFNISPSNEHLGLISFRMDWLDLLAVQGTLKSLLQHHSSKASILQHLAFFIVQIWGQEEKVTIEDEMAGWHHWLNGRESEWTPGVGDGQGGLVCCDSWGRKESDMTEWLIWSDLI